jgi:hypothetical protein
MMALAPPATTAPPSVIMMEQPQMAVNLASEHHSRRKRKAESPVGNERLSKRLSLLNLGTVPRRLPDPACSAHRSKQNKLTAWETEKDGSKLYVPVENPIAPPSGPIVGQSSVSVSLSSPTNSRLPSIGEVTDQGMQLDGTEAHQDKHKVYIYNLDDELSSESEAEDGKLVFLPDIEKHLRSRRLAAAPTIPPAITPNSDGELAGMQLVLYNVPSSITVPEEQDSVRKAIIEARARIRDKQRADGLRIDEEDLARPLDIAPALELPMEPDQAHERAWQMDETDADAMDLS